MELLVFFKCVSFMPVIASILVWNNIGKAQKYFGLFLFWGALNDIKAAFFEDVEFRRKLYVFYALTEVFFFGWFLLKRNKLQYSKQLIKVFKWSIVPFWAISFFILEDSSDNDHFSPLFDGVTAAFLSTLSAYSIYQLTLNGKSLFLQIDFYFSGGIFLYFFCNIFIFSVISDQIIDNAWFIHNSFHSAAMLIYTAGFIVTKINRENSVIS